MFPWKTRAVWLSFYVLLFFFCGGGGFYFCGPWFANDGGTFFFAIGRRGGAGGDESGRCDSADPHRRFRDVSPRIRFILQKNNQKNVAISSVGHFESDGFFTGRWGWTFAGWRFFFRKAEIFRCERVALLFCETKRNEVNWRIGESFRKRRRAVEHRGIKEARAIVGHRQSSRALRVDRNLRSGGSLRSRTHSATADWLRPRHDVTSHQ